MTEHKTAAERAREIVTDREIIARALEDAWLNRNADVPDDYAFADAILADLDKRGLCIVPVEPTCGVCGGRGTVAHAISGETYGPEIDAERQAWAERHQVPCPMCAAAK